MDDVQTRIQGRAGRITLTRPKALNALSHPMCLEIERALDQWREDGAVDLVIIDAEGERAFCAGGDIAAVYHAGRAGDYALGQEFWRDEYRMNDKLAHYPKPIVSFMQGFVMGGGVGLGSHVSHRIIGHSTQVAMPECGIGLIPDVGGTWLLARAPGHIGEYLGLTGARMGPSDAIFAGFADRAIREAQWSALIEELCNTGTVAALPAGETLGDGPIARARMTIDRCFWGEDIAAIQLKLETAGDSFALETLKTMQQKSALSMAATLRLIRMAREARDIREALSNEFRFTARACQYGEFIEGVRAQIIDKDRRPIWQFKAGDVPEDRLGTLLSPLPEGLAIDFGAQAAPA
ncbi:enoyl-CoA hydratase/isomerase family protein [Thioclava sp. GXIMD2076]|uniref:enoyl-CoA hydratase/isomerase family protein n=1 Tax=Thioclava sp. GXIMD2076 TaxID=3131931 RepID=UPI0030D490E2